MKLRSVSLSGFFLVPSMILVFAQSSGNQMNQAHASASSKPIEQFTSDHAEFKVVDAGRGQTKEGNIASFRNFEARDGTKLFTTTEFYDSASVVETQLKIKMKSFSELLERRQLRHKDRIVGERIVAKLVIAGKGVKEYYILRTSDKQLSYARSTSLTLLLDLEKWLFGNN